jgi:hypothetical protein
MLLPDAVTMLDTPEPVPMDCPGGVIPDAGADRRADLPSASRVLVWDYKTGHRRGQVR